MNLEQYILSRLTEECIEVGQDVSKAINFGLDDYNPNDPDKVSNRVNIVSELNDIMGVVELLIDTGCIPSDWRDEAKIEAKKEKIVKYMHYSQSRGRLDSDFNPDDILPKYKRPTQLTEDING